VFLIKIYSDEMVTTVDGHVVPKMLIDAAAQYSNAPGEPNLDETLRALLMHVCAEKGRKISVQIYDEQRQRWYHPLGDAKTDHMPADWDGLLPVRVEVKVGSWNG